MKRFPPISNSREFCYGWLLLLMGMASGLYPLSARAGLPTDDDWKYDEVLLKEGNKVLQGLLVDYKETAPVVELRVVNRKPGERTRVETYIFDRAEIASVKLLNHPQRELLQARLKALDLRGQELAERLHQLKVERVSWSRDGPKTAFRYQDHFFVLVSNVPEDLFRRVGVRLSQVYGAYANYMRPRRSASPATTIILAGTLADYRDLVRERGYNFFNPAFYDPQHNQIFCGCDLERLGRQLEQAHREHHKLRLQLKARQEELTSLYRGQIPRGLLRTLYESQRYINQAQADNEKLFQEAIAQLFRRLTHEAFHAYLGNFVCVAAEQREVPRWLNEGLAQIFETALFEGTEVRLGHADPERLKRAQAALKAQELVPLLDLLRATPDHFHVDHSGDKLLADRYYLTSWALASFLTFHCKVLNGKNLDAYAQDTFRKTDPVQAFGTMVGRDPKQLMEFEQEFRFYVGHLRPNGTVAEPK